VLRAILRGRFDARYDVNRDGRLTFADLLAVLRCWADQRRATPTPTATSTSTPTATPKKIDAKPTKTAKAPKPTKTPKAPKPTKTPKPGKTPTATPELD
jgi:hypothetical protein